MVIREEINLKKLHRELFMGTSYDSILGIKEVKKTVLDLHDGKRRWGILRSRCSTSPKSYESIAAGFGISGSRVAQIYKSTLMGLRQPANRRLYTDSMGGRYDLSRLDISGSTFRALRRWEYFDKRGLLPIPPRDINDWDRMSDDELLTIPRMGRTRIEELRVAITLFLSRV